MPAHVLEAFAAYLKLGRKRSLQRIRLSNDGRSPAIATLKRWSSRFGWAQLAIAHDHAVQHLLVANISSRNGESPLMTDAYSLAKERFVTGVLLGARQSSKVGGNMSATKISVKDYVRLLRLEHDLQRRGKLPRREATPLGDTK